MRVARFVLSIATATLLLRAGPCPTFDNTRCTKTFSTTPTEFELNAIAGKPTVTNFDLTISQDLTCTVPLLMANCSGEDPEYWTYAVPPDLTGGLYKGTVTFHPPAGKFDDPPDSKFCFGLRDGYSRVLPCTGSPCKCTLGPKSNCNPTGNNVTHSFLITLKGHVYGETFISLSPPAQTVSAQQPPIVVQPPPITIPMPLEARLTLNVYATAGKAEPVAVTVVADPPAYADIDPLPAVVNPGTTAFKVTLKPKFVRPGMTYLPKITITATGTRTKTGGAPLKATATIN